MDAKDKLNFINNTESTEASLCESCGARINSKDVFCQACGEPIRRIVAVTADNGIVICPICGKEQKSNREICISCGAEFDYDGSRVVKKASVVKETSTQPEGAAQVTTVFQYIEPSPAFASGLPEWSIEPPVIAVRRKARSL
jgi:predicted amidophosphoribosyltransferase